MYLISLFKRSLYILIYKLCLKIPKEQTILSKKILNKSENLGKNWI